MRSVAPARAGQRGEPEESVGVEPEPDGRKFTTTTLQTIQTAKARKSAGMEIHRFRFAIALPSFSQNSLSSGFQTVSTRDAIGSLLE